MRTELLLLSLFALPTAASAAHVPPAHCELHRDAAGFSGGCGAMFDFGETPTLMLAAAPSLATGAWRQDLKPQSSWSGKLVNKGDPDYPLELEVYSGGRGILRTEYGWYPVSGFTAGDTLRFTVESSDEVKPNELDRQIVARAAAILSDAKAWDQADTRHCLPTASTWSIYCAMEKATQELSGAPSHRRPALEVVREIVEDRSAGRNYHHRLMEYNNDPRTTLADVESLFREASVDMSDPAWLTKHGFVTSDF